jgi:ribosomal protein L13E
LSASQKKKVKPKGMKKVPARKKAGTKVPKTKVKAVAKEKPKSEAPKAKMAVEKKEAPAKPSVKAVEKKEAPAKPSVKAVEKKEAPAKPSVKAEPLTLGPPPQATIATRHIDSLHERSARGFSFGELASAGVPPNAAKREGLSLDIRRRSVVEGNVEALKGWFKSAAGKPASKTDAVAVPAVSKKK